MNPRRPIQVMLVIGLGLVICLSLVPSSLTRQDDAAQTIGATLGARLAAAPTDTNAGRPVAAFDVAAWYSARGEALETHGVLIETMSGDRLLASHNADAVFNPASLVKLATSLVALKQLGSDFRFETRVFTDGRVDSSGTLNGSLLVVGGDPTFGDVAASVMAKELRARGIKKVTGTLSVSNEFCFNFSESPEESAARLSKALNLGNPQTTVTSATAGTQLFKVESHRLRDLLLYMNAHSSNFVSERIGALIGGAMAVELYLENELKLPAAEVTIARVSGREQNRLTPRGLLTVIRALVKEAARQKLVPADIMPVASDDAGTLRRRLAGTGLEGAVVGKTGTLTAEVDGGMASLAGIVYTTDPEPLVFVILDRGNRIWENRQLEDQLLADVIRTLATPRAVASPTPRRLLPQSNLTVSQ